MKKLIASWQNTQIALGFRTLWDNFWNRQRSTGRRKDHCRGTKIAAYGSLEPRQLLASLTVQSEAVTDGSMEVEIASVSQPGDATISHDAIPGDANLDGKVDVLNDASTLVSNLGMTEGATWQDGDFSGDGAVDVVSDAAQLIQNLNTSVGAEGRESVSNFEQEVPQPLANLSSSGVVEVNGIATLTVANGSEINAAFVTLTDYLANNASAVSGVVNVTASTTFSEPIDAADDIVLNIASGATLTLDQELSVFDRGGIRFNGISNSGLTGAGTLDLDGNTTRGIFAIAVDGLRIGNTNTTATDPARLKIVGWRQGVFVGSGAGIAATNITLENLEVTNPHSSLVEHAVFISNRPGINGLFVDGVTIGNLFTDGGQPDGAGGTTGGTHSNANGFTADQVTLQGVYNATLTNVTSLNGGENGVTVSWGSRNVTLTDVVIDGADAHGFNIGAGGQAIDVVDSSGFSIDDQVIGLTSGTTSNVFAVFPGRIWLTENALNRFEVGETLQLVSGDSGVSTEITETYRAEDITIDNALVSNVGLNVDGADASVILSDVFMQQVDRVIIRNSEFRTLGREVSPGVFFDHFGINATVSTFSVSNNTFVDYTNQTPVVFNPNSDPIPAQEIGLTEVNFIDGTAGGDNFVGTDFSDLIDGEGGGDRILAGGGDDTVFGRDGDDELRGQVGDDVIFGEDGDDTLLGDAGEDTIIGGLGVDTINGGADDDGIYGNEGDDVLRGDGGNDIIFGGIGIDTINGGADDDEIYGEDGNDELRGDGGEDTIRGGLGVDRINGGADDDEIYGEDDGDVLVGAGGNDTIFGGDGVDNIGGGSGNDEIHGDEGNDILNGDAGDDTIFGGDGNDTFFGGDGADTLTGGFGEDIINGGNHDDEIHGESGNDIIRGDGGNDTITAGLGVDRVEGGSGNDVIHGDEGGDALLGEEGNDTIFGGANNDTITGGNGDDTLDGGTGNDTFIAGFGADAISGGDGIDLVNYSGALTAITVDLENSSTNSGDLAAGDTHVSIENLIGSDFDDDLRGNSDDNLITAGEGNDRLHGNDGDDILTAGNGNDVLIGGAGGDSHNGGAGTDLVSYGSSGVGILLDLDDLSLNTGHAAGDTFVAIERYSGTSQDDSLSGRAGVDYLSGEAGNDFLAGRAGPDTLIGGAGDDVLQGGLGADVLDGGVGVDTASYIDATSAVNVSLDGSLSNGGIANGDTFVSIENLQGSNFTDQLVGDQNANEFLGGGGNDRFIFRSGWGSDTIVDFANNGLEKIDFRGNFGLTSVVDLAITDVAGGVSLAFLGDQILLQGLSSGDIDSSDFLFDPLVNQVFTVNTVGDNPDVDLNDGLALDINGNTSLRAALMQANAAGAASTSTLLFDIQDGTGLEYVIQPTSALPVVVNRVIIDGSSQAGASVVIDGSQISSGVIDGLRVEVDDAEIRSIEVTGFSSDGIEVRNADDVLVTDVQAYDNSGSGIRFSGVTNSTLSDSVITGNQLTGVVVVGSGDQGNEIKNNRIGIGTDEVADGNGAFGLQLITSGNEIVGNTVSGNARSGVVISGSQAENNIIQTNKIGTDSTGTVAVGNGAFGILISNSDNNLIGGPLLARRNIVSGNGGAGISIGSNSSGNRIERNYVGLDDSGSLALANGTAGVFLRAGANDTTVVNNFIASNRSGQITIVGTTTTNNTVIQNRIGFGAGFAAFNGGINAVQVLSPGNTIGGTDAADGNVITGSVNGIGLSGTFANNNLVQNNTIGSFNAGAQDHGFVNGIQFLQGASDNQIVENLIAHSTGDAIRSPSGGEGNTFSRNRFRFNEFGIDLLGNGNNVNDLGDADLGPNQLQNSPVVQDGVTVVLASPTSSIADITITYQVDSDPANAGFPLTTEFFLSDLTGQDAFYVGSDAYTETDFVNGLKTITFIGVNITGVLRARLVATTTDQLGNTSELSLPASTIVT